MAERLNNHFQFLDVPRVDPKKKDIEQRKDRYEEIYYPYETREVEHQAHRCL
ncbi:MAG: glutamate synthase small subunit, partial [Pseudomonadota bacterium]|nr:glutamate synthase small subunit [Pseudomonadota bacterium]